MSAISSIGTSLLQLLQQAQQAGGGPQGPGGFKGQFEADFKQAAQAAGVDASKADDLFAQVQQAIDKLKANGAQSTDPRLAFKDAINSVLKQNGVDSTKFQAALSQIRATHHKGHKDSDGDSDGSSTAPATATPSASTASINGLGTLLDLAA